MLLLLIMYISTLSYCISLSVFPNNYIWQKHLQTECSSEKLRNWAGFCTLTVPCRCWKSYLPYSKRSENIINRKIRQFYIEAIPKKNLNSEKNNVFFEFKKKFENFPTKKFSKNGRQKSDPKSQISNLERIYFFSELRKKIWV